VSRSSRDATQLSAMTPAIPRHCEQPGSARSARHAAVTGPTAGGITSCSKPDSATPSTRQASWTGDFPSRHRDRHVAPRVGTTSWLSSPAWRRIATSAVSTGATCVRLRALRRAARVLFDAVNSGHHRLRHPDSVTCSAPLGAPDHGLPSWRSGSTMMTFGSIAPRLSGTAVLLLSTEARCLAGRRLAHRPPPP
jgi:hypothetical protein